MDVCIILQYIVESLLIAIVVPLVPGNAMLCNTIPLVWSVCTDDPGQAPHLHA